MAVLSLETLRDPDLPCDVTELTTADGARIHVRSYGPLDAPPLVLIHGFACRVEYWNAQINEFADRYRVIAYDQRGFGRSFLGARGVSPEVLGDDLAEVLELTVRGGRRAVLVGHSFGGITIMAWAQRHPGLVCQYTKAVLLTDTVAQKFDAQTQIVPFAHRFAALRRPLLRRGRGIPIPLPPAWLLRPAARRVAVARRAPRPVIDFMLGIVTATDRFTRAIWLRALGNLHVLSGLDRLTVPTTVLVGTEDRLTPLDSSDLIAQRVSANGYLFDYVKVPGRGHCVNIEEIGAFNAEVARLLRVGEAAEISRAL
ncbi:alpha/beta fold hydrolase [Mycobacteroides abscessus]|uniref:alpha/beta fold hydrolase n=1 Tax=Mycobacteroides abscessus TaxID=36809 RepID=UPI0018965640